MEEEFSDEEEKIKKYKLNVPMSEMEKRRKRMKKKRERDEKENKDKDNDDPNKGTFEIVAAPKLTLDDYDIDGLAFNRALAKKMLRKKTRDTIIDSSFNRHTVEDDDEDLPGWFKDDEDKHCYKINPITKEEFQMEK
jgi:AdoMet-dependent rRNA methyltransferase SPB1